MLLEAVAEHLTSAALQAHKQCKDKEGRLPQVPKLMAKGLTETESANPKNSGREIECRFNSVGLMLDA